MVPHKSGRVVVITGASSGIGRATAHAFADLGDTVVLAARRAEMLREVERECKERGGNALAIQKPRFCRGFFFLIDDAMTGASSRWHRIRWQMYGWSRFLFASP